MSEPQSQAATEPARTSGSPLNRDALNLPNSITVSRLLLSVVLFWLIWVQGYWLTAAILFVIAAATDALDGWVARRYKTVTAVGRVLDPFVDKIIVCGAFVFLLEKKVRVEGSAEVIWSGVNAWMVIIVIGREMFVTSLRSFMVQQGKDFSASLSGKLKMFTQCVAVTASLVSLSPDVYGNFPWFPTVRDVLLWTAVAITVWSGVVYIYRGVMILSKDDPLPEPP